MSRTHLLPEGRESHSRGAWSPWQHQEPKTTAGRRWDSWGEWSIGAFAYVTALCLCRLFPDPLDPLAGSMVDSSMPFPVLHSPSAKGGCEVSTVPMSPCPHMPITCLFLLLFLSLPDTHHPALTSHTNPSPSTPHAAPGDGPLDTS